ncbi:MAG: cytochrome c biogenesis protein CcdA [Caldimicrobium sp.]
MKKQYALAGLIVLFTLSLVFIGSLLTGVKVGAVTGGVEKLVNLSASALGRIAEIIPLGYAFGAGMLAAVNPCGFVLLPAYLGLYLGLEESQNSDPSLLRRLFQAILVSFAVTGGFMFLFGIMGLLISAGARAIIVYMPWIGLLIGVLLILVGAWLLVGGTLYFSLGSQIAAGIGNPNEKTLKGYFLFGISYGIASMSCTLPVFLTVVGNTITTGSFLDGLFQFIIYALGMGFVILILTLGMALFKGALFNIFRRALPYVKAIGALLLLASGAYIVYYWLTLGGLLNLIIGSI